MAKALVSKLILKMKTTTHKPSVYRAPWWLKNGHLQTIWTQILSIPTPCYRRELNLASCQETVVAYDFIDAPSPHAPIVVLFHGLEGSSHSHYAKLLMTGAKQLGFHGVIPHYRGCGGVANTSNVSYHAGDSHEVAWVINHLHHCYPDSPIFAMGVSLGGNALAKYLGETGKMTKIQAAAIVSAPLDMCAASIALNRGLSRHLYAPYFMKTLRPKALAQKSHLKNKPIRWQMLNKAKSLSDFDDAFTAPLYGFLDGHDYYQQSSAKPLLKNIAIPTLIINAQNDPFMMQSALPKSTDVADCVDLLQPKNGGHVGFVSGRFPGHANWLPQTVLNYFLHHLQQRK